MAKIGDIVTDISIDNSNDLWITGIDVLKYDGSNFISYNSLNSGVPSNLPYYLDTRCISIDPSGDKWIGCATAPYVSDIGIFKLVGEYAQSSITWTHQDLGLTGDSYETSKIYASPYGGEILAFVTELNGGAGVTGSTGPTGVTGGYLYRYVNELDKWYEITSEYNWSHTYDIKAKGIDGNKYEYWIATEIGIIIIPGGSNSINTELLDSGFTLDSVRILNENNSGLPSSQVYSIDFDSDMNLWIGTKGGLVFLSNTGEYTIWNSTNSDIPNNDGIYIVKALNNGQVFFANGNGYNGQGMGLFYFNGTIMENYTSGNSDLPNNDVTEIISFWKKSKNSETTYYPDEILTICVNDLVLFNYVTPHIYASAKDTGATGWNFVYHTPSDNLNIPRVDKYSWEYPSWRTYQDLYLTNNHPGLDRRNLFLSAPLDDIINGDAGNQSYWNSGVIPDYSDIKMLDKLPENNWIKGLTGSDSLSDSPNISATIFGDKYVIGISTSLKDSINLGIKPDGTEVIIDNPNSTAGSPETSELGLLVYYNKAGQLEGYTIIRGGSTFIYDIKPSPDNKSLYVLGGYRNYIEAGDFAWGNYPGGSDGGGPTGSAVGIANVESPNIQGATGDYPWILSGYTGGTGAPYFPSWYDAEDTQNMGLFIMEIDKNLGIETSTGGIDFNNPHEIREKYFVKNFRHFPSNTTSVSSISNAKLDVSCGNIKISANIDGSSSLLYTYSDEPINSNDIDSVSPILGNEKGSLENMSILMLLDCEFNLQNAAYTNSGSGPGTSVTNLSISAEKGNNTLLITGTAEGTSFYFNGTEIGTGITAGEYGYYILLDSNGDYLSSDISLDIINRNSISSASSKDKHYIFHAITGPTGNVFSEESGLIESDYGTVLMTVDPTGVRAVLSSYEVEFSGESVEFSIDDVEVSETHTHSSYYGSTGGNNYRSILKTRITGGQSDYYDFGADAFDISSMSYGINSDNDLFYVGTNVSGSTGPAPSSYEVFLGLSISHRLSVGKDMGSIISKAGTNPWKWADFHKDSKNMKIPLMSTVFFSNYDSNIFGKKNYRWVLTNQKTGEELLDIKNSPYFIYTFPDAGLYTIYNSLEDARGNTYEISKKAFIEVVNHREVREGDNQPGKINSYDYGYPESSTTRVDKFYNMNKDLDYESREIEKEARPLFGSGIVIKDNPDATFNVD